MDTLARLSLIKEAVAQTQTLRRNGIVDEAVGLVVASRGPDAEVGELCEIIDPHGGRRAAEVVGFRGDQTLLMPLGQLGGIRPGSRVVSAGRPLSVPTGEGLLGRVIDGLGRPLDGRPLPENLQLVPLQNTPPAALERRRIDQQLGVGVRALDGFLPLGRGQRMGIFAGSGVGKSSLLGMIARSTEADVNVIALVGERGREVREFIERDLGPEGLARSVVVVATSDQPALVRIKAALAATAIAETFRDQGRDVLLMLDSVTRFCMAQREVGLAAGEPPAQRGYTPSVFAMLPQLLERAGTSAHGSITGLYTVLVEGDDMNEPIADAARGILDGHVVLSRRIAHRGHYPAIDVLQSVSRLEGELMPPQVRDAARLLRRAMAVYADKEDLITIGAYQTGVDAETDMAIRLRPVIDQFLQQPIEEASDIAQAQELMVAIADAATGQPVSQQ